MDINTSYNNTERTSPLPQGEGVSGTAVPPSPFVSRNNSALTPFRNYKNRLTFFDISTAIAL